ncbi:calcium-binding protein [Microvirga solisilvae]|uniref:calcium-binding protein n=1 Tax=Microvirga solisilvae TaxID=2919498 RepID=UPI001FAED965|nr:calcium-binding protein [Microvirga solisilvae]
MSQERTPSTGAVKNTLDKTQTLTDTLHNFAAEVLERFGNSVDASVARGLRGVGKALGPIGSLAQVGLGYKEDGVVGAGSAAAGVLAGMALVAGIGAAVAVGGPLLVGAGVITATTMGVIAAGSVIVGGIGSWFVSEAVENFTKDYLKGLPAQPADTNKPDSSKNSPGPNTRSDTGASHGGGGSSGDSPGPGGGSKSPNKDDRSNDNRPDGGIKGGSGTDSYGGNYNDNLGDDSPSHHGNPEYNSDGWGGDPYAGRDNENGGYTQGGFGGDPYSGDYNAPDPETAYVSPIFLDLDGDGIDIIQLKQSNTYFDYNGDGKVGRTAWVGGGDGMLVIDLDKNGRINPDGVINQADEFVFSRWARGTRSDMDAVRAFFDTNRDGKLSAADKYFKSFRIWVDADGDAVSDKGELKTLEQLGITYIPLTHNHKKKWLADGSRINGTNKTITKYGKSVTVADVVFAIGSKNASTTVTKNGVDVDLGDGTVYNWYVGTGGRKTALELGKKGYEKSVLKQKDGTRLTASYTSKGGLSTIYHQTAKGKIIGYEVWSQGQYIHMLFDAVQKLKSLHFSGNHKNNTYKGGAEKTFLEGKSGHDAFYGGAGNDTLRGGDDNDKLYGDAGNDSLSGDNGDDQLRGGRGNDTLSAGNGEDILFGDEGNDSLIGGSGSDKLYGGAGNDRLNGNEGDDRLLGDDGDDRLDGGEGDDDLTGGTGDDTLLGAAGIDKLFGGDGDDWLSGGDHDDVLSGGEGHDRLDGGNGRDSLTGGEGNDTLLGGGDIDRLEGENGDDVLSGGDGKDTLIGGSGADSISGELGSDSLDGGADSDTLSGGAGDDVLIGGSGDDEMTGDEGNDQLDGGEGHDLLNGDDGNDTLVGDGGDDRLVGGSGNDQLHGGIGDDTLSGSDGNDTMQGGEGHDLLSGGDGKDYLAGAEGDDTLRGGLGADQLIGGSGSDVLEGEDGSDRIWGGLGSDQLSGGGGSDILEGEEGDDRLEGGDGDDKLTGGDGNDTLDGGSGHDQLFGGSGNDILIGGPGVDYLDGGDGIDTIVLSGRRLDYEIRYNAAIGRYSIVDLRTGSPDGTDLASIERFRFSDGEMHSSELDYLIGTDAEMAWNVENSDTSRTRISWKVSTADPSKWDAYVTHHDLTGAKLSETVFRHDGSREVYAWDTDNSQTWLSYIHTYDAKARLVRQLFDYDDNTRKVLEWDRDGSGPWWQRETLFDASKRESHQIEFDEAGNKLIERQWDYGSAVEWQRYTVRYDILGRSLWEEYLYDNGTRRVLEKDYLNRYVWTEREQLFDGARMTFERTVYDDASDATYGGHIITKRWDFGAEAWKEHELRQDRFERPTWERYIYDSNAKTIFEWDYSGTTWSARETRYSASGGITWQKDSYNKLAYTLREWDDAGEEWSQREFRFNEDGKQTWQEYKYDSGLARQVWAWNYDSAVWSSYWQEYDFAGNLANQKYVYDDGSYTRTAWTWRYEGSKAVNDMIETWKYDNKGRLYYESFKNVDQLDIWETDYSGAGWSKKHNSYVKDKRIKETITYDNKTKKVSEWDPFDESAWTSRVTNYDASGRSDSRTANWDDGTTRKWDWDYTTGNDWSLIERHYRAGEKILEDVTYDAGHRSRAKYDVFNEHVWKEYYYQWYADGTLASEAYLHDDGYTVLVYWDGRLMVPAVKPPVDELEDKLEIDVSADPLSSLEDELAFAFDDISDEYGGPSPTSPSADIAVTMAGQIIDGATRLRVEIDEASSPKTFTYQNDNSSSVLKSVMLSSASADDFRFVA